MGGGPQDPRTTAAVAGTTAVDTTAVDTTGEGTTEEGPTSAGPVAASGRLTDRGALGALATRDSGAR